MDLDTNQKLSILLLIGRVITFIVMIGVTRKQYRVLKARNYPELRALRHTLLAGSLVVLAGNILPIVIDVMGVFRKGSFLLLLAYVFSNNITAMLSAFLLWYNLRLSEKIRVIEDSTETND